MNKENNISAVSILKNCFSKSFCSVCDSLVIAELRIWTYEHEDEK